jgi:hypothetical protein
MGLVAEVLSHNGTLPQIEELYKKKKFFTRKNGILFSIFWFIFFVPFGAAFWGILDVEELAALSAVFGLFSSLLIFLFSLFMLGKQSEPLPHQVFANPQQTDHKHLNERQTAQNALPPQQTQYADDFVPPSAGSWKAPDTGEFARPGSVTEGTTKLLHKDDDDETKTYKNQ